MEVRLHDDWLLVVCDTDWLTKAVKEAAHVPLTTTHVTQAHLMHLRTQRLPRINAPGIAEGTKRPTNICFPAHLSITRHHLLVFHPLETARIVNHTM